MARDVDITEVIIRANNLSDCAHGCRYCPISRERSLVALERYAAFVARVREWIDRDRSGLSLYHSLGYHYDYGPADLEAMRRLDGDDAVRGISLGGLRARPDGELQEWLALLKSYGLRTVHATFAGAGATHDRWNHKPGNFDQLLRTLDAAGDLGLTLGQRLLVGESTLPHLDALLDALERLPRHEGDWRYAMPFYYQSVWQKAQPHVESDRIAERARDALPDRIRALRIDPDDDLFLSEREWIRILRDRAEAVDQASIIIRLRRDTIDHLEAMPIATIAGELEARIRSAYAAMPSLAELRDRYGDTDGTTIYPLARCVEMKWLDLFRADHATLQLEQNLTHCWFGA